VPDLREKWLLYALAIIGKRDLLPLKKSFINQIN
jgi:hypothetical protein